MNRSKITADDLVFIGLKSKVAALSKNNGSILWTTQLPGGLGGGFVTVNSDGKCVFAYTNGKIHCLDLSTGRILWTNELAGFGYGIASICIPGFPTAPDPAAFAKMEADKRSSSAASAS